LENIVLSGLMLLAALFLVVLNGLFVAAEFAFTKLRATRVQEMVQEGKASAGIIKEATGNLDAYLAVCQVGITIASLGLGALGEPAVATLIDPLLAPLVPESVVHTVAFVIAFSIITFLHVVFGELASKSVAIAKPEGTSQFVAPLMRFFYLLFFPLTIIFNGTANFFVRAFGIPPASEIEERHSEEELRMLVGQSSKQGFLEEDEEARVKAIFELDEKVAREAMVPRPYVVTLQAATPLRELVSFTAAENHTRYPVYESESPDRIIGVVHVKDVLRTVEAEGSLDAAVEARDIMRDVLVTPENKLLDNLLEDLQEQELQMSIVVDEWGSFEGIVTVEDILEEVVGEIRDEFDEEEQPVHKLEDGSYAMDGRVPIAAVNEAMKSGFESDDFDTVGGLILGQLGRSPEVGDEIHLDGYTLRVEEVDGPRVAQVVVRKRDEGRGAEDEPPGL
jgi:CBS domain containing-hemolysin-like protein